MTSANGTSLGVMKYDQFGTTRDGDVPTDRLPDALRLYGIFDFTGQRFDDTGLYYYNARYYDPELGRFISADIIISDPTNPQTLNRYSYCLNNPLKYVDPSGYLVGYSSNGLTVQSDFFDWDCTDPWYWYSISNYLYNNGGQQVRGEIMTLAVGWEVYTMSTPAGAARLDEQFKGNVVLKFENLIDGKANWRPSGDGYNIVFDSSVYGNQNRIIEGTAHEAFHIILCMDFPGLGFTRDEEVVANSLGYWAAYGFNGFSSPTTEVYKDVIPYTDNFQMTDISSFKSAIDDGIDEFNARGLYSKMSRIYNNNALMELQLAALMYWPWSPFSSE